MLGTIVNTACIIVGTLVGTLFKKGLGEKYTKTLVNELAIVGGVLIISSGLSILDIKDCKTLNYIPALLVPIVWFLVKGLFI